MRIIGVCGRKGGSGKTTTAIHLAADLASRGLSVALVDADQQGSATYWSEMGGPLPMPVHFRPLEPNKETPQQWAAAIRAYSTEFLVLDSPPHLDPVTGVVIGLSELVLLPCGPSELDLKATSDTVDLVREIRSKTGSAEPSIILVPNRLDQRTATGRELVAALGSKGEKVSPPIHSRVALADSCSLGVWVGQYAPGSAAHREVTALTDYTLKQIGYSRRKAK